MTVTVDSSQSSEQALPAVLVTDAAQRASLAVIRSLGKAGVPVIACDTSDAAIGGASRYCQRYVVCPDSRSKPLAFIDWVASFCRDEAISVVFPITETSSQALLMHPQQLQHIRLPFTDFDRLITIADKASLLDQARACGLEVPHSYYYDQGSDVPAELPLTPPFIAKPSRSNHWLGDRWLSTEVSIVRSAQDWQQLLQEREDLREHPILLQEFIPGRGAGIFALYHHGEPLSFFAHRRLREKPPSGGVSVWSESCQPDPGIQAQAKAILDRVQWHGVAMIEFRVDDNGKAWLMEVNTRFWGSLQLAIDAGFDFPWLLYQSCVLNRPIAAPKWQPGNRLRWWLGDLDRLYLVLKSGDFSAADKCRAILQFLRPDRRTRHEVNRWSDLKPAWLELKQWLSALKH